MHLCGPAEVHERNRGSQRLLLSCWRTNDVLQTPAGPRYLFFTSGFLVAVAVVVIDVRDREHVIF